MTRTCCERLSNAVDLQGKVHRRLSLPLWLVRWVSNEVHAFNPLDPGLLIIISSSPGAQQPVITTNLPTIVIRTLPQMAPADVYTGDNGALKLGSQVSAVQSNIFLRLEKLLKLEKPFL